MSRVYAPTSKLYSGPIKTVTEEKKEEIKVDVPVEPKPVKTTKIKKVALKASDLLKRGNIIKLELMKGEDVANKATIKDNHVKIGKAAINLTRLVSKNVLSIRPKCLSGGTILSPIIISSTLKDAIVDFLESHEVKVEGLNDWDRSMFMLFLRLIDFYGKKTHVEFISDLILEIIERVKLNPDCITPGLVTEFEVTIKNAKRDKVIDHKTYKFFLSEGKRIFKSEIEIESDDDD